MTTFTEIRGVKLSYPFDWVFRPLRLSSLEDVFDQLPVGKGALVQGSK